MTRVRHGGGIFLPLQSIEVGSIRTYVCTTVATSDSYGKLTDVYAGDKKWRIEGWSSHMYVLVHCIRSHQSRRTAFAWLFYANTFKETPTDRINIDGCKCERE